MALASTLVGNVATAAGTSTRCRRDLSQRSRRGVRQRVAVFDTPHGRRQQCTTTAQALQRRGAPQLPRGKRGRCVMRADGNDDTGERSDSASSAQTANFDFSPPRGFNNIEGDEGVAADRKVLPESVQDVYRMIEDPAWLESELLRADDGYPTSRAAVLFQAASTGDLKGFAYAITSVSGAVAFLVAAYVAAAAARVGAEEGELMHTVGQSWTWLLFLGGAGAVTEVQKFIESVVGAEGRRKM
mmetsp:Transcript_22422/g.36185  ORF Transcript_22422/g.36185 Transcript_22422/m.36185 type:complete len:243 (-) Transcript_22422:438-1166(-)